MGTDSENRWQIVGHLFPSIVRGSNQLSDAAAAAVAGVRFKRDLHMIAWTTVREKRGGACRGGLS